MPMTDDTNAPKKANVATRFSDVVIMKKDETASARK